MDDLDILFQDINPDFFFRLPDGGGNDFFAPVEVPGDNAVVAVFVAGVVAAQEEDFALLDDEQVDGGFECVWHDLVICGHIWYRDYSSTSVISPVVVFMERIIRSVFVGIDSVIVSLSSQMIQ